MNKDDLSKFAEILAVFGEMYDKSISGALAETYWQALKHFDWVNVQKAFETHATNPDCGQFFPEPIDLVWLVYWQSANADIKNHTKDGKNKTRNVDLCLSIVH